MLVTLLTAVGVLCSFSFISPEVGGWHSSLVPFPSLNLSFFGGTAS